MPLVNKPKNSATGNIKLPGDIYSRGAEQLAKQLAQSAGIRRNYSVRIGNPETDNPANAVFVPDTNNARIYITGYGDEPDSLFTMPKAGIPKEFLKYGQTILVKKSKSGQFQYDGIDAATGEIYNEGDGDAQDQLVVTQSQFDFASLQPYSGMVAVAKGFIFGDNPFPDTVTADFSASPLDTNSVAINIPSTANTSIAVLVQINTTTGVLSYKQSASFTSALTLSAFFLTGNAPVRDTGNFRLGYLKLTNGQTFFDNASVWTCADFFPAYMYPVSGGATDEAIARWDGATGRLLQDSFVYLDDNGNISGVETLNFNSSVGLEITGGVVTVTATYNRIDTQGGAGTDDLDTITWASGATAFIFIRAESAARTVVVKHGTGNIETPTGVDISLDETYKVLLLLYDNNASVWKVVGGAGSGGSGTIGGTTGANDERLIRADGGGGSTIQASTVSLDDSGNFSGVNTLGFVNATELTISSGAITRTASYHKIDTEADAGTDDLDTISGGTAGQELFIRPEDTARAIVVRHNGGGTGNIRTPSGGSITLDELYHFLHLIYDGTNWNVVGAGMQPLDADLTQIAGLAKTKGNLIAADGTDWQAIAVGADGRIPFADSTDAEGIAWKVIGVRKTYKIDVGSNQTTTSTSYGNVTNTSQSHTFTYPNAKVMYHNAVIVNSGANDTFLQAVVNGNTGTDTPEVFNDGTSGRPMEVGGFFTGISTAGAVTIQLQMKVSAGTGTLNAQSQLLLTIEEYLS